MIGREFPVRTLRAVYPVEDERQQLPTILQELGRLDFISLEPPEPDARYLFTHVITQEAAYDLLLFAQRRQLHRSVAEWYEGNQGNDPTSLYPLLAHHWRRADVVPRAIDYLELAGEAALRTAAYQETVRFFEDAIKVDAEASGGAEQFRRARWERQLGEAYLGLGHTAEGRQRMQSTLALLGSPVAAGAPRLFASILKQLGRQLAHRTPQTPDRALAALDDPRLEAARAYIRLVETYWFANETVPLIHASLSALNLAESAGPSPELSRAYAMMCLAAGTIPWHRLAELYGRQAVETARQVHHLAPLAYVLLITSVYRIGTGQWERVQAALGEAMGIFEQLGDARLIGDSRTILGMVGLYKGEFARNAPAFSDVLAAGRRTGNIQHQVWGLIGRAEAIFRLGQLQEAAQLLQEALAVLTEHPDRAEQLRAEGLLAALEMVRGEERGALDAADRAARLIDQLPSPTAHYLLEGYAGVAEVHLRQWEGVGRRLSGPDRHAAERSARRACSALRGFARVFPIGRPRAWLFQGWAEWLAGRPDPAHAAWRRSLHTAGQLEMRYELGRAYGEIGRHLAKENPARVMHLTRAVELLSEVGAASDLARLAER